MELKVITEQWRPVSINGSESGYFISNQGNIWSSKSESLLNPGLCSGYKYVILYHENRKHKLSVHRLVAITFIPNPNNLKYVNHRNGNVSDNRVDNLEWISSSGNKQHATKILQVNGPKVGVDQYSLDGTIFIAHYDSIAEASRQTGTPQTGIVFACRGKYKSSGGFKWKYTDATRLIEDPQPEGMRHQNHPCYIITNTGKIYNTATRKYLTLHSDKNGYQCVSLCTNGNKQNFVVHVLVARFFVPNPDPVNKIYVNHINNKRDDNDCRNLEWVTQSENINHAYRHGGLAKKLRSVIQYDMNSVEIQRFVSVSEAARFINVDPSGIHQACKGTMQQHHGFKWKFADEMPINKYLSLNITADKTTMAGDPEIKYLTLFNQN
ncbi:HNH endonuclease [uncultured virus]|nr:HNH endonuclease [uncultured virus]